MPEQNVLLEAALGRPGPVVLPERSRGNWFTQQRLRFIEARLFWHGRINRADLMDYFQIHRSVASEDIADYQAIAPNNMVYDRRQKVYRANRHFMPVFGPPSVEALFAHTVLRDWIPSPTAVLEWVTPPARAADPVVARNIIAALEARLGLRVFYRSMEDPLGRWRWIEPHRIVSDGHRWHVRAYCHDRGRFRDFVLSRIEGVDETRPSFILPDNDADWHEIVEVLVRPHRKLTLQQRKLVEKDYGMKKGIGRFESRRALLWYALLNLGLDEDREPPRQLLELVDQGIRGLAGFSDEK